MGNDQAKTKTLALAGILSALTFLLGMTPIGLIPLGFINVTIMCIPVIVGTLITGLKTGILLGAAFGLASTLSAFGLALSAQSTLALNLLTVSPLSVILMSMLPRICVPITANFVYKALTKNPARDTKLATAIAAVCASLTNTVLYLGLMYVLYTLNGIDTTAVVGLITGTALIAGPSEAAVAAIICVPVVYAINRFWTKRGSQDNEKRIEMLKPSGFSNAEELPEDYEYDDVKLTNVASIQSSNYFADKSTPRRVRMIAKAWSYFNTGAYDLADSMFDMYEESFNNENKKLRARLYVMVRNVELQEYDRAVVWLVKVLESGYEFDNDAKKAINGVMLILHSVCDNASTSPVFAHSPRTEQLYSKALQNVKNGEYHTAGRFFDRYWAEAQEAIKNQPMPVIDFGLKDNAENEDDSEEE